MAAEAGARARGRKPGCAAVGLMFRVKFRMREGPPDTGMKGKPGKACPGGPLGFPVRRTGRGSALKGGHGAYPARRIRRGAGRRRGRRRAGRMARRAWAAWLLPIPHAAGRHRRHGEPVGAARGRVPDRLAGGLPGTGGTACGARPAGCKEAGGGAAADALRGRAWWFRPDPGGLAPPHGGSGSSATCPPCSGGLARPPGGHRSP